MRFKGEEEEKTIAQLALNSFLRFAPHACNVCKKVTEVSLFFNPLREIREIRDH